MICVVIDLFNLLYFISGMSIYGGHTIVCYDVNVLYFYKRSIHSMVVDLFKKIVMYIQSGLVSDHVVFFTVSLNVSMTQLRNGKELYWLGISYECYSFN